MGEEEGGRPKEEGGAGADVQLLGEREAGGGGGGMKLARTKVKGRPGAGRAGGQAGPRECG